MLLLRRGRRLPTASLTAYPLNISTLPPARATTLLPCHKRSALARRHLCGFLTAAAVEYPSIHMRAGSLGAPVAALSPLHDASVAASTASTSPLQTPAPTHSAAAGILTSHMEPIRSPSRTALPLFSPMRGSPSVRVHDATAAADAVRLPDGYAGHVGGPPMLNGYDCSALGW